MQSRGTGDQGRISKLAGWCPQREPHGMLPKRGVVDEERS